MIFGFPEVKCIFSVLKILAHKKSKYSIMFKETRVSHTTLQKVLRELVSRNFVKKYDIGHQNVDYEITDKGRKLFSYLTSLNEILA